MWELRVTRPLGLRSTVFGQSYSLASTLGMVRNCPFPL